MGHSSWFLVIPDYLKRQITLAPKTCGLGITQAVCKISQKRELVLRMLVVVAVGKEDEAQASIELWVVF